MAGSTGTAASITVAARKWLAAEMVSREAPCQRLVGLDRNGDCRELALLVCALWASFKRVSALDEERMHRIGLC